MAREDINKGFGNLPPWLTSWFCPDCKKDAPVEQWQVKIVAVGANDLQGRQCPNCDFIACQTGDTERMLQQDKKAVKIISDRDKPDKEKQDNPKKKISEL